MDLLKKNGVWIAGLVWLVVLYCTMYLPVFWDMYGQVKTASYYLETGFADLLPSGNSFSDNGHLPLYPLYLALLFKIFGFKLWVAHFSVFPFLLGVLWQLKKFCSRFLSEGKTLLVLALTFFHPAFLTQGIYFSSEITLVFSSLWLLNALLANRASHIALASVLLCLFNLRGISLCGVLLCYFLFAQKNKNAWYILCGIICWVTWAIMHYIKTGWFFSGPEIKEFRAFAGVSGMLKNAALSVWKVLDLGSVFGWATILVISIKRKKVDEPTWLLLLAFASVLISIIPFTNPIGNRYFLLCYVLLLPAFVFAVTHLQKKIPTLVTVCFCIVLFSNNGVMYPDQYGNAWDCSLKSLPYFELRAQLDEYLAKEKISPADVEAGFQVYFNDTYYLMNGKDREYALLSDTEMPHAEYVVDSDICNNYNEKREKYLQQNYIPVKEFRSGAVYLHLYKKELRP